jgi:hypothetical protein
MTDFATPDSPNNLPFNATLVELGHDGPNPIWVFAECEGPEGGQLVANTDGVLVVENNEVIAGRKITLLDGVLQIHDS